MQGHERAYSRLGYAKVATFLAGAVIVWLNWYWLPVPVIVMLALFVYHDRVDRKVLAEKRGIQFYEQGLRRLNHEWIGTGQTGERFRDPSHPYADDLDLFGRGSMFELICSARTFEGEATLASWLKNPGDVADVRARQEAIQDMAPHIDLREDLALLGEDIRSSVHSGVMEKWAALPPVHFPAWARHLSAACASVMAVLCLGFLFDLWSSRAVLIWILVQGMYGFWMRNRVLEVLEHVETPARDLRLIGQLLARFEGEEFTASRLLALKQGASASAQIRSLDQLIEWQEQSHNQFFAPIARLLLWSTQFSIAIESWRMRYGAQIATWIRAVGELEALSSLSCYSAEHPADPFPELRSDGPCIQAIQIGHPLLPEETVVRNDVELTVETRLLLVSGSNMSGKSTLLRALGLNVVLGWAGAPVRAKSLSVSRLEVGASIRIQDSLLDGRSRFYAEILRLKQIVDMAGKEPPLFYLLDELLSGTNSHDRKIGAEAVVRSLVERNAIGLVTTHDLALTELTQLLAPRARNVHFEDHIENGAILFDYRMRPGIVSKSNAIELMRSIGLQV